MTRKLPAPVVSPASHGSPLALLREVLENDRAAIAAMKKEAPWYEPDAEILDLHRRIESCLSANESSSATAEAQAHSLRKQDV